MQFSAGDLAYSIKDGLFTVRKIHSVKDGGYLYYGYMPNEVLDSNKEQDDPHMQEWNNLEYWNTLSRQEQFNELFKTVPIYWRKIWCGGGVCGCLGCINKSGHMQRDVQIKHTVDSEPIMLHKGFTKEEYDLYFEDAAKLYGVYEKPSNLEFSTVNWETLIGN